MLYVIQFGLVNCAATQFRIYAYIKIKGLNHEVLQEWRILVEKIAHNQNTELLIAIKKVEINSIKTYY